MVIKRILRPAMALALTGILSLLLVTPDPAHANNGSSGTYLTVTTQPADLDFPNIQPGDRVEIVATVNAFRPGPVHLAIAAHPLDGTGIDSHQFSTLDISQCSGNWAIQDSGRTPRAACSGQVGTIMAPTRMTEGQPLAADLGTVNAGAYTYRIGFTFDADFGATEAFASSTQFDISATDAAPTNPDQRGTNPDHKGTTQLPYTGGMDPRWAGLILLGALLIVLARQGHRHIERRGPRHAAPPP